MKINTAINETGLNLARTLDKMTLHVECLVIPEENYKAFENVRNRYFATGRFVSEPSPCKEYRFITKVRKARMVKK